MKPKKITCKCGLEILLARSGPGSVVVCRHCQRQLTVPSPTHQMPAITIEELAKYSKEASTRKAAAPPGEAAPQGRQKPQRSVTIAGMIICPQCGTHFKRGVPVCAECGTKLIRRKFELGTFLSDGVEVGFREFFYLIIDVFKGLKFLVKLGIVTALILAIALVVLFIIRNYENIPVWLAPKPVKTAAPATETKTLAAPSPLPVPVSAEPEPKTEYQPVVYQPETKVEETTRKKGGIKREYSTSEKAVKKKSMAWYRKKQQEAEALKNKAPGTETTSPPVPSDAGKLGKIQGDKNARQKAVDELMKAP